MDHNESALAVDVVSVIAVDVVADLASKSSAIKVCAWQLAETNTESAMGMIFAYDRKHIAAVIAFDI